MTKGERREARRKKKKGAPVGSQARGLAYYHVNRGQQRVSLKRKGKMSAIKKSIGNQLIDAFCFLEPPFGFAQGVPQGLFF